MPGFAAPRQRRLASNPPTATRLTILRISQKFHGFQTGWMSKSVLQTTDSWPAEKPKTAEF
jgi:hypothetical protein